MEITSVNNEIVKNTAKLQQKNTAIQKRNFCWKDTKR